jgi:hypothetical protein
MEGTEKETYAHSTAGSPQRRERDFELKLKSLDSFRDEDDLLRVKTTITQREESDEFQCPVVNPRTIIW